MLDRLGLKASFFVAFQATEEQRPLWPDRLGHSAWAAARETPDAAGPLYAELDVDFRPTREAAAELVEKAKLLLPQERTDLLQRVLRAAGGDRTPEWDGFMSWSQLRSLIDEGHEIGSHSLTHELLTLCSDPSLQKEVAWSRSLIEERLQTDVVSFCYPNGDVDDRVADAVRDAGYRQAVTTSWGLNGRDQDPLLLKRCDMPSRHATDRNGRMSEARVAWRISGLHPGLRA